MKKVIFILACSILFACLPFNLACQTPSIKKMALFPVMIGPIQEALRHPSSRIQAKYYNQFNERTHKLAGQIMDAQKNCVNKYRDSAANLLKKYFACDVVYGKNLQKDSGYLKADKAFNNPLSVNNDSLPAITVADGEFNPFNFNITNEKVISYQIMTFFKSLQNYQQTIKTICDEFNVDALAFSFSYLDNINFNNLLFEPTSYIYLHLHLVIFDKEGNIVVEGSNNPFSISKNKKMSNKYWKNWNRYYKTLNFVSGDKITDYQQPLDDFPVEFENLVNLMASEIK